MTFKLTIVHLNVIISGMEWKRFEHPDICFPVIKHHISDEFVDFCINFSEVLLTGGRSLLWSHFYPSKQSYHSALYRLRKTGLIVKDRGSSGAVGFSVVDEALVDRREIFCPHKKWDTTWRGKWYLLSYDVPESDRHYRNELRHFLQKRRLGWLHKSLWVTPEDIRPAFCDLCTAIGLSNFAHLFEARSVLGRNHLDVVLSAWNFTYINRLQRLYLDVYGENLSLLKDVFLGMDDLIEFARNELRAYGQVLQSDPLLPYVLYPRGYQGKEVFALHREIALTITHKLKAQ